ncbi:class F sortase [Sphaerisporangium fuscum]|uniref:class F sortase n=1 Tax=Sphaerisporangium fuscum TaxID=2835868 RepID=UPI0020299671|nr:class F sortase [Sphaerisporangium fuscum]
MRPPGRPSAQDGRKRWQVGLLPVLLTVGSLAGIGAVMAGLLMYLSPTQETAAVAGTEPTSAAAQLGNGSPVAQALEPAVQGEATVGPGGAGVPLVEAAPTAAPPSPAAVSVTPLGKSLPKRVRIPGIGVDAALTSVGVEKNGEIEVPPLSRPQLAGWYELGPAPGEMGPAVILGHVNTKRGPAVFSRLRELKRGDKVTVVRADGSTAVFTVDGVEQASKSRFPTKRVYGYVDKPSLRLITCGGIFNSRAHSYTDNIIVYATLSGSGRG